MIDLISVANMRQSDAMTIASGVSGITLMARAAQGIYEASDKWSAGPINIVTGSGNNGGDGFALAAVLAGEGIPDEYRPAVDTGHAQPFAGAALDDAEQFLILAQFTLQGGCPPSLPASPAGACAAWPGRS